MVLDGDVAHVGLTTGLERVRLAARALPGHDLDTVDLSVRAFGTTLGAPVLISCMTGGTGDAGPVNAALAAAAQHHRVALGLGSGRVLLQGGDPASFEVRDMAPDVPLLANLGAVQLAEVGIDGCRELVERTRADALVLHLNAVQEAVQPEGDTGFGDVLDRIADVVAGLGVPVVAKEVGFGMAADDVRALVDTGVAAIDVAGAGGTNWARVEGHRDTDAGAIAAAFVDWGWSTHDSLVAAVGVLEEAPADRRPLLVASGGLAHGVDAVKCLCLGADLVGFGRRLIAAGAEGPERATSALGTLVQQMRIAVWGIGATRPSDLGTAHLA